MPAPIQATDIFQKKILNQVAVYWHYEGRDENGQPLYSTPVEIDCRWEDVGKLFLNDKGQEEVSRSIVYVDRDLKKDSVLWLGDLNDLEDLDDPLDNDNAWSIRYWQKIPNRRATKFVRIATL